jgi:hypothetical protein
MRHIEISNLRQIDDNRNLLVKDYEIKLRASNQKCQEL